MEDLSKKMTDRARKVLKLAKEVAGEFGHEYVGTEHLLVALLREGQGVAAITLKNLDVADKVETEVRALLGMPLVTKP